MKTLNKHWLILLGLFSGGSILVIATLTVWSQTAPILTITSLGTNQYSITITNNIGTATHDLLWTPVLGNPDYPWTWAAIGTPGQTNYVFDMGSYQTAFFQTILDTNSVPLWEAADPNNPGAGILAVFIDNPANGTVLQ
jgi:hypothetical protein